MKKLMQTKVGQLRIIGFLEGLSLIILMFIAVPAKYMLGYPMGSQIVGSVHGVLFILFIVYTIMVSIEMEWKFTKTTWKVLLSSFIPFGTFYVDKKILSKF